MEGRTLKILSMHYLRSKKCLEPSLEVEHDSGHFSSIQSHPTAGGDSREFNPDGKSAAYEYQS